MADIHHCQLDLDGCYRLVGAILRLAFIDASAGNEAARMYLVECGLLAYLDRFNEQASRAKYFKLEAR